MASNKVEASKVDASKVEAEAEAEAEKLEVGAEYDVSNLSLDDLKELKKQAQQRIRVKKASLKAKERRELFAPALEAFTDAIGDDDDLREYVQTKDAVRIYLDIDEEDNVIVKSFRPYKSRKFSDGDSDGRTSNGKAVEVKIDGDWQDFESHAKACRKLDIDVGSDSAVRKLHANVEDDRIRTVSD